MKNLFLFPGQLAAVVEPTQLSTMLGSCVGVTIWDTKSGIGGLNHYLLPTPSAGEKPSPRYGSFAMKSLIDEVIAKGATKANLVARVYGGAAVLGNVSIGQKIGEKNIELALQVLAEAGIRVVDKNVGGNRGRKIHFNTQTGEVQHLVVGESTIASSASSSSAATPSMVDTSGFSALQVAKDVKVLVVDDSATVRTLFTRIFEKHGLKVVGAAANAFEAREMIVATKPDVITLDIEMPQMNGVRFLEKLMKHMPVPTVMVSSLGSQGDLAMDSLRLGAIEFVQKPSQSDPELLRQLGEMLVTKVRAAASSKLVAARPAVAIERGDSSHREAVRSSYSGQISGIFVSGNTGAPKSLQKMLANFTADSPPLVIAVSTLGAFLESFIADLKKSTKMTLRIATSSTMLTRGTAYFIPEGVHGRVSGTALHPTLTLEKGAPIQGQLPSGNVLLSSAAEVMGPAAVGVLLSGFGKDGVEGFEKIQAKGGLTLAEDPSTASFPFVSQTAIAEGLAAIVLGSDEIFSSIMDHRSRKSA